MIRNKRLPGIPRQAKQWTKYWKATVPALLAALALAGCAHTGNQASHGESRKALLLFDTCAKPSYPKEDLAANHQGTVRLSFLVDEQGNAVDSKILQSSGYPTMDEAARGPIQKCKFRPALQDGRPAAQWTNVLYVWTIS